MMSYEHDGYWFMLGKKGEVLIKNSNFTENLAGIGGAALNF